MNRTSAELRTTRTWPETNLQEQSNSQAISGPRGRRGWENKIKKRMMNKKRKHREKDDKDDDDDDGDDINDGVQRATTNISSFFSFLRQARGI